MFYLCKYCGDEFEARANNQNPRQYCGKICANGATAARYEAIRQENMSALVTKPSFAEYYKSRTGKYPRIN